MFYFFKAIIWKGISSRVLVKDFIFYAKGLEESLDKFLGMFSLTIFLVVE